MARRSDHSREQIREMALDAAEAIVREEGIPHLSARRIARAIGYTVGTLYLVFENLDDLILQVNARTLDELYGEIEAAGVAAPDPEACLLAMGRVYVEFTARNPQRWALIFERQGGELEAVPVWFQARIGRMFGLLEEVLARLGGRHGPEERKTAARALWGGVHGICILAMTRKLALGGQVSVRTVTDSLIRHYLAGYAAAG